MLLSFARRAEFAKSRGVLLRSKNENLPTATTADGAKQQQSSFGCLFFDSGS